MQTHTTPKVFDSCMRMFAQAQGEARREREEAEKTKRR